MRLQFITEERLQSLVSRSFSSYLDKCDIVLDANQGGEWIIVDFCEVMWSFFVFLLAMFSVESITTQLETLLIFIQGEFVPQLLDKIFALIDAKEKEMQGVKDSVSLQLSARCVGLLCQAIDWSLYDTGK